MIFLILLWTGSIWLRIRHMPRPLTVALLRLSAAPGCTPRCRSAPPCGWEPHRRSPEKQTEGREEDVDGNAILTVTNRRAGMGRTCLLMSAPAWVSHTTQWGCPPKAAVCVGVWLKRLVTVFTSQPLCTRWTTHSSCGSTSDLWTC